MVTASSHVRNSSGEWPHQLLVGAAASCIAIACVSSCRRKAWGRSRKLRRCTSDKISDRTSGPVSNKLVSNLNRCVNVGNRRIAFIDFWPGFDTNTDRWLNKEWFVQNLDGAQVVDVTDKPNVIMFSCFGVEHRQYMQSQNNVKLVFYTGERTSGPVGKVGTVLDFDHVDPVVTERGLHMRLPLWTLVPQVHDVLRIHSERLAGRFDTEVKRRGSFCGWVASNGTMYNSKIRNQFVQTLSEIYKRVDCGGAVMNNVGGRVNDKMEFLSKYKFSIAFENASYPGYCTEKLLHAFAVGGVPIYWGDPRVEVDFNPKAFIDSRSFKTLKEMIDHIAAVDQDDELLERYLKEPIFSEAWYRRLSDYCGFCKDLTGVIFRDVPQAYNARQSS